MPHPRDRGNQRIVQMRAATSPVSANTQRGALVSLSLAIMLSSSATSIVNVALPTLSQAFAASFQQVQWVVLAYLLAITALIVGAGRLGDLFGPKRVLIYGVAIFGAGSILCALAPSIEWLIAARAIQGAGAAIMMALSFALVSAAAPPQRRGAAMGILGASSAVGTALGPALGGVLIQIGGWQAIFASAAAAAVITFAFGIRFLPADREAPSQPASFDTLGTAVLALTIGAYALAMTIDHGAFGFLSLALLAASGVGVALFVVVETRAKAPLIRPAMFADSRFSAGLAANAIVAAIMMATLVVGPFYLAAGHGLDIPRVGLVMSVGPFVAALAGIPAGLMVDRFGADRTAVLGLIAIASGAVMLAAAPPSLGVAGYILPIAIVTAAYALFQAANNSALIASAPAHERGLVSATMGLARNLGLITGAALLGAVFAAASGLQSPDTLSAAAATAGMRATFSVAAASALVAIFILHRAAKLTPAQESR